MKKVVLFDIDYTLFDKDIFLDSLFTSIGGLLKIDKDKATEAGLLAYKENIAEFDHFEPIDFSLKLAKNLDRKQELKLIKNIVEEKYNNPGSLYKETVSVLKKVSKVATIGILSKGHGVFQRNKIASFKNLLSKDHIYISDDKYETLKSIASKYGDAKLYLVDDLLDILYSAEKLREGTFTIWIKRGKYADVREDIPGFTPDATVETLSEIVPLILEIRD